MKKSNKNQNKANPNDDDDEDKAIEDDESDDMEHMEDPDNPSKKKINNIHLDDHEKEKYAYMMFSKDPEKKAQYKAFKDCKIDSSKIKRYLSSSHNVVAGDLTALILAAVSKIYLGELIEEARSLMTENDEVGPIQPLHLKLAY
jgi:transcription initiation factor TFIID subunit 11